MFFTLTDKTLMMRAGRLLVEQARVLKAEHGVNGWGGSAEAKEAKRQHDRLLRDDRELRELAKRIERNAKAIESEQAAKVPQLQQNPT